MNLENPSQKQKEPDGTDRQAEEHSNKAQPPILPSSASGVSKAQPPPSHPTYKIACEKKRDVWDWIKFAAEIVGIGVVIVYTSIAALQWCEMQKQTRIQRDAMIASERPRMALDQERGQEGITFDRGVPSDEGPKTVTFFLRYSLKNFGHSPAQVSVSAEVVNQDVGTAGNLTDRVKTKCITDRAKVKAEDPWPETIVKEGSFGQNENQLKITPEMRNKGFINPSVIGCIWYRSPAGTDIYQTGFAGQISMRTDDDWNRKPIPLTLFRNGIPSTIERSKFKVVDILMSNAT